MYEYDNSYIYVDLERAKEFAGLGDGKRAASAIDKYLRAKA